MLIANSGGDVCVCVCVCVCVVSDRLLGSREGRAECTRFDGSHEARRVVASGSFAQYAW